MRFLNLTFLLSFLLPLLSFGFSDTTNIPIARKLFHDKIVGEQRRADKMDGKQDGLIKVGNNAEVNLQVTDAIIRKINVLRNDIEGDTLLSSNQDKIRYLRYIEFMLRDFNNSWHTHKISPTLAPALVDNFSDMMYANLQNKSIAPYIQKSP